MYYLNSFNDQESYGYSGSSCNHSSEVDTRLKVTQIHLMYADLLLLKGVQ